MQASAKEIASIRMDATGSLDREARTLRDTAQMAFDEAGRWYLYLLGSAAHVSLCPSLLCMPLVLRQCTVLGLGLGLG